MKYQIMKHLLRDSHPNGTVPESHEPFFVGDTKVTNWIEEESPCGCTNYDIYPAFLKGKRCWYIEAHWNPTNGYVATGGWSALWDFRQGVEKLIELDIYSFDVPKQKK